MDEKPLNNKVPKEFVDFLLNPVLNPGKLEKFQVQYLITINLEEIF